MRGTSRSRGSAAAGHPHLIPSTHVHTARQHHQPQNHTLLMKRAINVFPASQKDQAAATLSPPPITHTCCRQLTGSSCQYAPMLPPCTPRCSPRRPARVGERHAAGAAPATLPGGGQLTLPACIAAAAAAARWSHLLTGATCAQSDMQLAPNMQDLSC
uniref:Uncharacterized protein n=1 Tax=Chlamydomonas leiostraca TaxID=1034604 RepID=A0A7S0R059_9CHLO|mmetsp:Transcript_11543/g.28260  ORF Transcript_11543/g.28260 Transcript_11543/m.28260 type:complete len:158 (+) Transcript_11543:394-867(+)